MPCLHEQIWGLHLKLGRKLAVTGVFLLGALYVNHVSCTHGNISIDAYNCKGRSSVHYENGNLYRSSQS